MKCTKRSFAFNRVILASTLIWFGSGKGASAETAGDPAVLSGLSFDNVRAVLSPVGDFFTSIVFGLLLVGEYVLTHAPAAAILSTIIAATVAVRSISSQREMARLRETFSTIDAGVWDKDVIAANENFKKIRDGLKASSQSIAKYASPSTPTEISEAVTLTTILDDYENIALGVRYNIIDELYLLRWMRSSTISDWERLSPLVTAYRAGAGGSNAYVEFEGLVTSWQHGKSYRTGKKITHARRLIRIS